jgi:flagellar hook-basal body complex protein FliE
MNSLFLLAQAATNVDPNAIGVSVTSLVGSLGAAGAAVAVTYYFLGYLRNEGQKQDRIFSEFRDYHAESQKKFQDQLERLADRQEQFQRGFQDQVARMSETQNALLRDCILAMKTAEKTLDNSTATVQGMEKAVGALQVCMNGIDVMIRRMIEVGTDSKRTPPTPGPRETPS